MRQIYHLSLHHAARMFHNEIYRSLSLQVTPSSLLISIFRPDFNLRKLKAVKARHLSRTALEPEIPSRRLPQLIPQLEGARLYVRTRAYVGATFPGSASCCTPVAPPWRRHPPGGGSLTYRICSVELCDDNVRCERVR